MALTVGSVVEGKVTSIAKFGAFVELPEGESGLVHISEIAHQYVEQVTDHLQKDQTVKVKVLEIGDNGKISLSIKQASEAPRTESKKTAAKTPGVYEKRPREEMGFDDMLNRFLKDSQERHAEVNAHRRRDGKRNSKRKKTQNN